MGMKAVVLSIAGTFAIALLSFAADRVDSGEAMITETHQSIRIQSEAQPNHITRRFPNSGNPHRHGARPTGAAGCEWSEEAQLEGKTRLGLDQNQAHVQPGGLYHDNGIPQGLINTAANTGRYT